MANEKYTDITNDDNKSDVISEIESLTEKYGLTDDFSEKNKTDFTEQSTIPQRNINLARTPKVVYDINSPKPSVHVFFDGEVNTPQGPQGRRVIYSETDSEPISSKRLRNKNMPQRTIKGSMGFGNQPYVKHVASSPAAIKRNDPDIFLKTYSNSKSDLLSETTSASKDIPISSKETPKLVAANSRAKKKAEAEEQKKQVYNHYETSAKDKFKNFFKAFLPWKGDSGKEVLRKIVMDLSAVMIVICFGYFIDNYVQHQTQIKTKEELTTLKTEENTNLEAQWAAIKAKYPNIDFPDGMNINFAELYAANQDLVGWLSIDNTNIDTSVLFYPEDKSNNSSEDFYLHHNFYKQYDKYGNAYLDKYNSGLSLDKNNTIYGHNMTDGLSFAQLEKYYKIDGFKESPVIKYSTLFNDYYFKIYAVIITNGYSTGDNGYLFNYTVVNFPSQDNFGKFIEALDERKLYNTGVDITKDDTLLTLSTCSYEIKSTDMGRLAVVGRMVRPGESTAVDTSKATENTNIRYPQIWYNEHKMTNPYANSYQWKPE